MDMAGGCVCCISNGVEISREDADHKEDFRDECCQESFTSMWYVMRLCTRTLGGSTLELIKPCHQAARG